MTVVASKIGLGLWVPNSSFSIPSDVDGVPAGWVPSATIVSSALYSGGPSYGHPRFQRFELKTPNTTGSILSAPTLPKRILGTSVVYLNALWLIRCSGTTGANQEALFWLNEYAANDDLLYEYGLITQRTVLGPWTLVQANQTLTPKGAATSHWRFQIKLNRAAADVLLDIAQIGIQAWTAAPGYWTAPQVCDSTRAEAFLPGDDLSPFEDVNGFERWIDHVRGARRRSGSLGWDWLPEADALSLRYLFDMNKRRSSEAAAVNPAGGRWPLLVIPGHSAWPAAALCRMTDKRLNLQRAAPYMEEAPYFNVTVPLLEVL